MTKRIEVVMPVELVERIDEARGFEPRGSFIKRLLDERVPELVSDVRVPAGVPVPVNATRKQMDEALSAAPARETVVQQVARYGPKRPVAPVPKGKP